MLLKKTEGRNETTVLSVSDTKVPEKAAETSRCSTSVCIFEVTNFGHGVSIHNKSFTDKLQHLLMNISMVVQPTGRGFMRIYFMIQKSKSEYIYIVSSRKTVKST